MGDWDEFGDGTDISDTSESLDSFDDSSLDSFEEVDVSSTLDSVEPIEETMEVSEEPIEEASMEYVDSVMDSVDSEPIEFEESDPSLDAIDDSAVQNQILETPEIAEEYEVQNQILETPEATSIETQEVEESTESVEQYDTSEYGDDVKILKRDETELWQEGNAAIENTLEAMRDDLRDKGLEDGPEMEALVMQEKTLMQEELAQNIEGNFDNPYDKPSWQQEGMEDLPENIESFESDNSLELSEDASLNPMDQVEAPQIEFEEDPIQETSEEVYEATPNSEVEILQEDGTVDTLENIQNNLEEQTETTQEVSEEVYEAKPNSEVEILQEDGTTDSIENIQNSLDASESDAVEMVEGEVYEINPNADVEGVEATDDIAEVRPIDEIGDWLEDINPNFDPFDIDSPYCNNCGSCTYAVYQRLEGNSNDICATAENIGYNEEMEALTGMEQVSMSPEEIQSRLLEAGDGAHAIIGIDRAVGPGHWFNAANIGGKVVAIDGQSGEIRDWPPDYGDVTNWEMSLKKEDI